MILAGVRPQHQSPVRRAGARCHLTSILKPDLLSGMRRAAVKEREWKAKGQSCAYFIHRMSICERVTQRDVETQIIANFPDESDQSGNRLRFAKLVFVEKLCNRPDRPFYWSLDDTANEHIRMMVTGERGFSIQVDRSPVPPL
jgi:hypothetical protein